MLWASLCCVVYYYYYYYRGLSEDYTGLHGLKEVVAVLGRAGGRSKNSGGLGLVGSN